MSQSILQFTKNELLGRIAAVDTTRIHVAVDDHSLLTRTGVGHLVAIRGQTAQDFLIAVVERVIRRHGLVQPLDDDTGDEPADSLAEDDQVVAAVVGTYRAVDGDHRHVFKRGADSFPQIDSECHVLCGENLQRLMALLGSTVDEAHRLVLGEYVLDRTAQAVADGNRFFQRHAAILGSTGSGKSWAVALLLERASALAHPNIIVLDMHGEYRPLATESGHFAEWLRVAGPGDLEDPAENVLFLPYWTLNREELLSMFLDRSDSNAPNQAHRFTTHVRAFKEATLTAASKSDVLASFTVDSPVSFDLHELLSALESDNAQMVPGAKPGDKKQGEWYGKLTRFISRLKSKVDDRRYGFLFRPPSQSNEYDWLARLAVRLLTSSSDGPGIKIIDFSEVPSDVLPVVVGVFARLLYEIQFWLEPSSRTPLCFVCDEAHLYLPTAAEADVVAQRALDSFERIAKEGRKYGVSLLVVSQRPADVSRTILSQCNNFVALRLSNPDDQSVVKKLLPDSMSGMMDILPLLDVGEAYVLGDSVLLPSRVKLTPPRIKPDSATRAFWSEWASKPSDDSAIAEAVETLRRQSRLSRSGK